MGTSFKRLLAGTAATLALAALPVQAALIVNGGFESGLSNWTVANQTGSDGSFTVQSGLSSPVTGTAVPAPPGGSNAAMTDAEAGGSHVLYQDFTQTVAVTSARLRFDIFIGNRADAFHVPAVPTLDWATAALNQHARVDVLGAGADPFSVALADVLVNAYLTNPGDPLVSGYRRINVDITGLLNANLNRALRLRFSEVDNVNMFQFGVDNVDIVIDGPSAVPEPMSLALVLSACAAALLARRRALVRHAPVRR